MKILVLAKFHPIIGGTASDTFNAIKSLCDRGHEVHLVSNGNEVENDYLPVFDDCDFRNILDYLGANFHYYELDADHLGHIPSSPAYFERLSGKGSNVVENNNIDLVVGWYFQPYGAVGSYISLVYSLPLIIIHSGSDLSRLTKNKNLYDLYKIMLTQSTHIISKNRLIFSQKFSESIASKVLEVSKWNKQPDFFKPDAKVFEWDYYKGLADNLLAKKSPRIKSLNNGEIDTSKVFFGVYSKCHPTKGLWIILDVLKELRKSRTDFHLIYLFGGRRSFVDDFIDDVYKNKLEDHVSMIPFIPYMKIPEFIQFCDIIFNLELNFPYKIHSPQISLEVMSMGKCLITSKELVSKSPLKYLTKDNANIVVINEPSEVKYFSARLNNIIRSKSYVEIGKNAATIYDRASSQFSKSNNVADLIHHLIGSLHIDE